jgi:hypothetical protein
MLCSRATFSVGLQTSFVERGYILAWKILLTAEGPSFHDHIVMHYFIFLSVIVKNVKAGMDQGSIHKHLQRLGMLNKTYSFDLLTVAL